MPEARLEDFGSGLAPVTDGWFVVNVRDAEWLISEGMGARCAFECETPPSGKPIEFCGGSGQRPGTVFPGLCEPFRRP